MNYSIIIGLEVHVQLLTKTKLFCGCLNLFNPDNPNVQTCPVCLGLPGSLPVMNGEAFRLALKTGLALKCDISQFTKWDRKQYYYPDLPKAYQISQYDLPFSHDGWLEIELDAKPGTTKKIGIIRAHLEEDAGKNMHDESGRGLDSRVDLNRCGTPLVEIVSEPDLRSPQEAKTFLEELKLLLRYLGVSDCNMQEGSLRCDANINLHIHTDDGHQYATPIVEIKNLNSFRGVEASLQYEVQRQISEWNKTGRKLDDPGVEKETRAWDPNHGVIFSQPGKKQASDYRYFKLDDPTLAKETRGWDPNRGVTFSQRGKEEASDYRYFPDPDLVPVTVSAEPIDEIRATLCEFPADRRKRFREAYDLSAYDVSVIVSQGRAFADYFEDVAQGCGNGKQAANWCTQDVLRELNERQRTIERFPLRPEVLSGLLGKVNTQAITVKSAREVFVELIADSETKTEQAALWKIDRLIEERGLAVVSDTGELEAVIGAIIEKNPKAVADFQAGKQAAVGSLIGQVMRDVKGADPKLVRQMLIEKMG